ncbi:AfsR/SARP family transcriptional regulator [Haloactinomyces albus]|uniref:DNA-binding SARP family transcriptional activator n=1 Tax=Haloactinomyces albus TaxID=1352928 RepID=A0AAE4CRF8_9ACTN|nr:AfsR/SARP family transcriptional regulator [Haloactinomyces albus]MDR7303673.1 DNA-binding SARP family transcriptional activator [Haloactinomyces albus]
MRYEILGPIQVVDSNGTRLLTARKLEILLTVLLVRHDQVITTERLVTELWGENPPRRANAALHVYVSQLRKFLKQHGRSSSGAGARTAPGTPIVTRPLGYMLLLEDDEIDVDEFQRLMHEGRGHFAQGRSEETITALEKALRVWRASSLEDLKDGVVAHAYATFLEESRLECLELLMETYLRLERYREVIGRLYTLISQYPLRENFYRHLMLGLYRCDRQADALAVYRDLWEHLRDELGLEPCTAVQQLHYAILAREESLDRTAA